jgi:hypothetical protein
MAVLYWLFCAALLSIPLSHLATPIAVPSNQPHARAVAPSHDAEAVVFDLMQPVRPSWRLVGRRRQARFAMKPTALRLRICNMAA